MRVARESGRLRAHFREVMAELGARDVAHLSAGQRAQRARLIDELARYARAGRFPKNLDFPGIRMPYFVDTFGTRCAMAHLIESTGAADLVARVATLKNNAFVRELERDADLQAWLDRAGLTAAEAARIQPSYCYMTKADACFCTVAFSNALAEGTVLGKAGDDQVTVRIDAVHGDASTLMPGQDVQVYGAAAVGDDVLVAVSLGSDATLSFFNPMPVAADGTVQVPCNLDVPALKKDDAIAAFLASAGKDSSEPSACSDHLATIDAGWGASTCDDDRGGGCAIATPGAASPLMLGAAFLSALVVARSRRARRLARARAR
ncbi:hypothetical protein A7982_12774 [Minicystis rosea]|nr:hypothetical protein A7982_12774 [Minicystis rosea]